MVIYYVLGFVLKTLEWFWCNALLKNNIRLDIWQVRIDKIIER